MPRGADAPQRTENRERRTERPCGATDKVVVRERRSRRLICPVRPICPIAAFWQEMLECATAKALCRAASSVALWHVADVPGVQGELLPAGVWGGAPHPQSTNQLISQSANQLIPACGSTPLICSKSAESAVPSHWQSLRGLFSPGEMGWGTVCNQRRMQRRRWRV